MGKYSANVGFLWNDLPLLDRIAAAGRTGFSGVAMDWPYAHDPAVVTAALKQAGVVLLGVNTPLGNPGEFGLAALAGRERDFEAAFETSLSFCKETGGSYVHAMAGLAEDNAVNASTLIANLKRAAAPAADAGVMMVLEAPNSKDRPGYFYSHLDRVAEIIGRVGAPNVKMIFDFYHAHHTRPDVLEHLHQHLPLVGLIQIASIPSRHEPDEGTLDYKSALAELDQWGYTGWIDAEYRPRTTMEEGLGWIEKVGIKLAKAGN